MDGRSDEYQRYYYQNHASKQTTWDDPRGEAVESPAVEPENVDKVALPAGCALFRSAMLRGHGACVALCGRHATLPKEFASVAAPFSSSNGFAPRLERPLLIVSSQVGNVLVRGIPAQLLSGLCVYPPEGGSIRTPAPVQELQRMTSPARFAESSHPGNNVG